MANGKTPALAPDPLAAFTVAAPKRASVIVSESAPRVADSRVSDVAYVTRAVRLVGRDKNEVPVLLLRDGSSDMTFPLSAIGAAISGGVISPDEISALQQHGS